MKRLVAAGALAGAMAGASLALFLRLVGEPAIARAVALEARLGGARDNERLFGREAQEMGGMAGAVIYGVCLGVVAALVLNGIRRRCPRGELRRQAMALAAVALCTLAVVPFLKYPANPPGVGDPDTIARRTALYLGLLAWSVLASWASWRLWMGLGERAWRQPWRAAMTAGAYAALVGAALLVLPPSPHTAEGPADLVRQFRLASLGGAAVFWAVLGWALGSPRLRSSNSSP